jgi:predicted membrane channel-forming protein YqfA (hemolysin III family)
MLKTQNLLRIVIEMIFVLLGAMIIWLGLQGRILFNASGAPWMILSVVLILWGLRAFWGRRDRWWARWEHWTSGLSLILLGAVMIAIARAPFGYMGRLMAVAGGVLVLRGLINSVLVLRPR